MNIVLPTPNGAVVINLTKTNAVDLREACIVVLFASEKTNNLTFQYTDKEAASKAFSKFTSSIEQSQF